MAEREPLETELQTYNADISEMARRKSAYTRLVISLFCGLIISTIDLMIAYPVMITCVYAGVASFLIASRWLTFRWLRKMEYVKVLLDKTRIERFSVTRSHVFKLNSVAKLWIKRTVRGTIRVIKITTNDGKQFSITGLNDFEAFKKNLRRRVGCDAVATEFREPLDFDHPLFYVFFGFFTGLAAVGFFRLLFVLDRRILIILHCGIICFLFVTGIWWIYKRPFACYGIGGPLTDYLFGAAIIGTSMIIAWYS